MSTPPCMINPPGPHLWGTKGRKRNAPKWDDMCIGCHRRYGDIKFPSAHEVNPHLHPLVMLLGRMYQGRP